MIALKGLKSLTVMLQYSFVNGVLQAPVISSVDGSPNKLLAKLQALLKGCILLQSADFFVSFIFRFCKAKC